MMQTKSNIEAQELPARSTENGSKYMKKGTSLRKAVDKAAGNQRMFQALLEKTCDVPPGLNPDYIGGPR